MINKLVVWPVDKNLAHDTYFCQAILIDFIISNTPEIFVKKYWVHSFLQRDAFRTSQGAFAHLRTTPLHWRARNFAITMSEMSVPNNFFMTQSSILSFPLAFLL